MILPPIEAPKLKLIEKGKLPNMRYMVMPDKGKIGIDMDLDRADLQVVVWEADDDELRAALRDGVDMHLLNAATIFNLPIPYDECKEGHPNQKEHKARYKAFRNKAKIGVHATNYGVGDRKLALSLGITVQEASQFRKRWFEAHPGIKRWHQRTIFQLAKDRTITNRFGYRIVYFDRPEVLLTRALAWLPQSTVAIVIDKAMDNIATHLAKEVDILLQVHDSLFMQCDEDKIHDIIPKIREQSLITIPYDQPLVIPVGFEVSNKTWGDVDKYERPDQ